MAIEFRQRLTCTIREALDATGIGLTKFYDLVKAGKIKTRREGTRRLVLVPSLIAHFDMSGDGSKARTPPLPRRKSGLRRPVAEGSHEARR